MKMNETLSQRLKWSIWSLGIVIILIIAFVLRSWDLTIKPPHFDEGINGHFVDGMWKEGFYRYDPTNFHGPLYFYFLQLAEVLFGRSIWAFRFMNGFISLACVALVARHRRFFGKGAIWAALFMAVSPAFVFYSRYAIHESLFIFLLTAFVYGWFQWQEKPSRRAAIWMALGFYGSIAVKETFFIFYGTWLIAWGSVRLFEKFEGRQNSAQKSLQTKKKEVEAQKQESIPYSEILVINLVGALLTVAFFTGFFLHLKGFVDMFTAFKFWTHTGTGASGHEKPFMYWLQLLYRYEWPALLGLVVSPVLFFFVPRHQRILVLAGFGHWLAYSIIPYKTPWLVMNFIWLQFLTLGLALEKLSELSTQKKDTKWSIAQLGLSSLALVALLVSVSATAQLNFKEHSNPKEGYVYVQSTLEFHRVISHISKQVERRPEDLNMKIMILNKDPWPLPWVLGHYPKHEYGTADSADLTRADVILIDSANQEQIEAKLQDKYWRLPFQIRDAYQNGFAYLRFQKFLGIVASDTAVVGTSNETSNEKLKEEP